MVHARNILDVIVSRWGINSPPGVVKELQGGQVNLKKNCRGDTFCIRKNHLLHIGKFCSLIINLHILNMSQSVVNGYNYGYKDFTI